MTAKRRTQLNEQNARINYDDAPPSRVAQIYERRARANTEPPSWVAQQADYLATTPDDEAADIEAYTTDFLTVIQTAAIALIFPLSAVLALQLIF